MGRIRIGVSACLLGEKVRHDGGHKLDPNIAVELSQWFEFVPVCPEFEMGLGVPREPMQLEGDPRNPSLVTINTRNDLTEPMRAWCRRRVQSLEKEKLHGFVFKGKSPSCGMERVEVFPSGGLAGGRGSGLFAKAFKERFPRSPTVEEGTLNDPAARDRFVQAVRLAESVERR